MTTTSPGGRSDRVRTLVRKAATELGIPDGQDVTKAQIQAVVKRVIAGLDVDLAELEKRLVPRAPSQAQLQAVMKRLLEGLLDVDEKICAIEKARGGPDRTPIAKMGLTPAEQLAEIARRGPTGSALRKNGAKVSWEGFLS